MKRERGKWAFKLDDFSVPNSSGIFHMIYPIAGSLSMHPDRKLCAQHKDKSGLYATDLARAKCAQDDLQRPDGSLPAVPMLICMHARRPRANLSQATRFSEYLMSIYVLLFAAR